MSDTARLLNDLSRAFGMPTHDQPRTGRTIYELAKEKYGDRFDDDRWLELTREGNRVWVPLKDGGLGSFILEQGK